MILSTPMTTPGARAKCTSVSLCPLTRARPRARHFRLSSRPLTASQRCDYSPLMSNWPRLYIDWPGRLAGKLGHSLTSHGIMRPISTACLSARSQGECVTVSIEEDNCHSRTDSQGGKEAVLAIAGVQQSTADRAAAETCQLVALCCAFFSPLRLYSQEGPLPLFSAVEPQLHCPVTLLSHPLPTRFVPSHRFACSASPRPAGLDSSTRRRFMSAPAGRVFYAVLLFFLSFWAPSPSLSTWTALSTYGVLPRFTGSYDAPVGA